MGGGCLVHKRTMKGSVELAASGGTYDFDYTNKWGLVDIFFQCNNATYGPLSVQAVFCDGQTSSDCTLSPVSGDGLRSIGADVASKICVFRTGNILRVKNNTAAKIRMMMFGYWEDSQSLA